MWFVWIPGSLLATCGVLAIIWKVLEGAVEAKRTLRDVRLALPKIQAEFSPNGGQSMKDQVNRIERKVDRHERILNRHEAALDRIEDQTR